MKLLYLMCVVCALGIGFALGLGTVAENAAERMRADREAAIEFSSALPVNGR